MILTSTSDIVRIVTTGTPGIDVQAGWADITTTTFSPGRTNTKITTATTTTIVASPAASTQRQVKTVVIRNIHATDPNTITVQHYDGTNSVDVYKITLAASESIEYDGQKWQSYNASGLPTNATTSGGVSVADIGSTAETVGGSVANGSAATAARSDHKHAITNPAIDTLAAATDITTLNASTSAHGLVVKATAPAAGLVNVVGIENGETAYTNKALFDATSPSTQAFGDAAAVGTAVVSARRDHKHAMMAAPTSVSGNAGTVTVADAGGDTTTWPLLGTSQTGSLTPATDAGLTYNATDNALTAATFIGALTGTASGNLVSGGALGTPSSGTVTNLTGTASININGTVGATTPAAVTATTITANTSIILQENAPIILDPALSADGKYSGITEEGTAGATLAFGDLVYLQTSDSRWELVDANAEATCKNKLGICVLAAASDGSATTILLYGKVRADAAFPALTIGAAVFASTTAGDVQTTAPSGAADIMRIVGYGNTADELFFCPSPDYYEHV